MFRRILFLVSLLLIHYTTVSQTITQLHEEAMRCYRIVLYTDWPLQIQSDRFSIGLVGLTPKETAQFTDYLKDEIFKSRRPRFISDPKPNELKQLQVLLVWPQAHDFPLQLTEEQTQPILVVQFRSEYEPYMLAYTPNGQIEANWPKISSRGFRVKLPEYQQNITPLSFSGKIESKPNHEQKTPWLIWVVLLGLLSVLGLLLASPPHKSAHRDIPIITQQSAEYTKFLHSYIQHNSNIAAIEITKWLSHIPGSRRQKLILKHQSNDSESPDYYIMLLENLKLNHVQINSLFLQCYNQLEIQHNKQVEKVLEQLVLHAAVLTNSSNSTIHLALVHIENTEIHHPRLHIATKNINFKIRSLTEPTRNYELNPEANNAILSFSVALKANEQFEFLNSSSSTIVSNNRLHRTIV